MTKLPQVLAYEMEPYLDAYDLENLYDAFPEYLNKSRLYNKKYNREEMFDMFLKNPKKSAKFFDIKKFIVSWNDDEHMDVLYRNPEIIYKLRHVLFFDFLSSVFEPIGHADKESYIEHLTFEGYEESMDWPSDADKGLFWARKDFIYYKCIKSALQKVPEVYVILPEVFYEFNLTIADYNFYKKTNPRVAKRILKTPTMIEGGYPSRLALLIQKAKPHGGIYGD